MNLRRHRMRGTLTFVAWRTAQTLGVAAVLTYLDHPFFGLWWIAGNALIYALMALNAAIELEKRFPEAD